MEKEVLAEVERELAKTETKIAELRDEFAEKFTGSYNGETLGIETKCVALEEWKNRLIATKQSVEIMCDGGIVADAERKAKVAVADAESEQKFNSLVGSNGTGLTRYKS